MLTAVEITSVAKGYGSTLVLDDVNIRFEEGTFTSLLDTLDANQQSTNSIQESNDNLANLLDGLG